MIRGLVDQRAHDSAALRREFLDVHLPVGKITGRDLSLVCCEGKARERHQGLHPASPKAHDSPAMTKPPRDSAPTGDTSSRLARLEQALSDALARTAAAEAQLTDQRARLEALGQGREESMRALVDARSALRQMTIERDEARQQLARVDDLQTATITLPDEEATASTATPTSLPSIEELMAGLGEMTERGQRTGGGHLHVRVQTPSDSDRSEEMLSPEVVFPEEYAKTAQTGETEAVSGPTSRVLVLLDGEQPIKYPLYKESMTIGRADSADIQINSAFISRLHARVESAAATVTVADIGSKNGIKVNSKLAQQHTLRHGDVIAIGPLRFRFLDTAADDER